MFLERNLNENQVNLFKDAQNIVHDRRHVLIPDADIVKDLTLKIARSGALNSKTESFLRNVVTECNDIKELNLTYGQDIRGLAIDSLKKSADLAQITRKRLYAMSNFDYRLLVDNDQILNAITRLDAYFHSKHISQGTAIIDYLNSQAPDLNDRYGLDAPNVPKGLHESVKELLKTTSLTDFRLKKQLRRNEFTIYESTLL